MVPQHQILKKYLQIMQTFIMHLDAIILKGREIHAYEIYTDNVQIPILIYYTNQPNSYYLSHNCRENREKETGPQNYHKIYPKYLNERLMKSIIP